MLILFISLLYLNLGVTSEIPPECIDWFKESGLTSDHPDCDNECSALMVGMGDFWCKRECSLLCKTESIDVWESKLIFYPGLTSAEKKLIANYPDNAITVFKQKNIAEESSSRNFPDQGLSDESDAFRHFVWAGLLTKELGSKEAKKFLNAHEADPTQSPKEYKMDVHNNSRGILATEKLIKENGWTLKNLETRGLEEIRSKKLEVLKPGLQVPEKPR